MLGLFDVVLGFILVELLVCELDFEGFLFFCELLQGGDNLFDFCFLLAEPLLHCFVFSLEFLHVLC